MIPAVKKTSLFTTGGKTKNKIRVWKWNGEHWVATHGRSPKQWGLPWLTKRVSLGFFKMWKMHFLKKGTFCTITYNQPKIAGRSKSSSKKPNQPVKTPNIHRVLTEERHCVQRAPSGRCLLIQSSVSWGFWGRGPPMVGIYCQLGDYMLPTRNLGNSIDMGDWCIFTYTFHWLYGIIVGKYTYTTCPRYGKQMIPATGVISLPLKWGMTWMTPDDREVEDPPLNKKKSK